MRIAVFATAYYPLVGGAEIAAEQLIDQLPEDEWVVLTARQQKNVPYISTHKGARIFRIGFGYPRLDKCLFILVAPLLTLFLHLQKPFTGVWSLMVNEGTIAALLTKVVVGLPYVISLQTGLKKRSSYLEDRFFHYLTTLLLRSASGVQAISKPLQEYAYSLAGSVPIRRISNGVNVSDFAPISPEHSKAMRKKWGIPEGAFVCCTAGRFVHSRGTDILLRVLADLPDIYLVVAGDGEDKEMLLELADTLGISKRVVWLGMVPNGAPLGEVIASCDVFARGSRSEGLPLAFLEAMACGVPVVAPRVGGIPDILKDRQNGLLVSRPEPGVFVEALRLLQGDSVLCTTLSEGALSFAQQYSWEVLAPQLKALLLEAFGVDR